MWRAVATVPEIDKASIENLSEVEHGLLFHFLAEDHPRVLKTLLGRIDEYRAREAARKAMPAHPFTTHEGMSLCYWRFGAGACLRSAGDEIHATEADRA